MLKLNLSNRCVENDRNCGRAIVYLQSDVGIDRSNLAGKSLRIRNGIRNLKQNALIYRCQREIISIFDGYLTIVVFHEMPGDSGHICCAEKFVRSSEKNVEKFVDFCLYFKLVTLLW